MKYCPICEKTYGDEAQSCAVDGATLRESGRRQDTLVGKVVKGRYQVLEKLGEGGMGAVYLAEQVAISRKVALKLLHADYARDEEFVKRFRQEAKLAAALNHRNVVTIFDFDQADDGSLYIVMEYVAGKNLARVVQEGPIEIGRALRLAIQIADGLTAAHRAGVIHRDVKPENIMVVGAAEEIKLMDFGISRLRDTGGASRLTRSGTIMGTPAYMAPEQIDGAEVSEQTDVYAFGIVLYEMLSGAVPFQARTPGAVLIKHLQETAAPLRKIRREVPSLVERLVTQALEKEPERRQKSMQAVVDALKEAQRRLAATRSTPFAKLGSGFTSAAIRLRSIFNKPRAPATLSSTAETSNVAATLAPETATAVPPLTQVAQEPEPPLRAATAIPIAADAPEEFDSAPPAPPSATVVVTGPIEEFHPEPEPAPPEIVESPRPTETQVAIETAATMIVAPTMASQEELANERTAVLAQPQVEVGKAWHWQWIGTGTLALAVIGGVIYYQLRQPSIPSETNVAAKTTEVASVENPPPASPPQPAETDAATTVPATENVTVAKPPLPENSKKENSKKEKDAKISAEKSPPRNEVKAKTVVEAPPPEMVTPKSPVKADSEKPAKEKATDLASLKPTKPVEVAPVPAIPEVRLVSLSVLADKKELKVDSRVLLTVKGKYSDGKENDINGTVRWESSDRSVAIVNSRGELEARKEGKAQITASYSGLTSPSYTFFVKGAPPPPEKAPSSEENIQDLRRRLLR